MPRFNVNKNEDKSKIGASLKQVAALMRPSVALQTDTLTLASASSPVFLFPLILLQLLFSK